jgi:hypothetical protein
MTTITEADKLRCVERELRLRRRNFPIWVKTGRMQQVQADREIELMAAIVEDYRKLTRLPGLLDGASS